MAPCRVKDTVAAHSCSGRVKVCHINNNRNFLGRLPVVVGVCGKIASLDCPDVSSQFDCIKPTILNLPSALKQVECEHRERMPLCGFCKPKDIKAPVVLCVLQGTDTYVSNLHAMFGAVQYSANSSINE